LEATPKQLRVGWEIISETGVDFPSG